MEGKFEADVLSKVATYERVAARFGLSLYVPPHHTFPP
jgi:hypothetical protein